MVKPRMIYISNSTELGGVYSRQELVDLSAYCRAENLLLFMDGARLGHAITAENNELGLEEIAQLVDVFTIGGTKNGALLGDAIVFTHDDLAPEFDYVLKQKGALLSKGRLLGIQFLVLFQDDLYFDLARHANQLAGKIVDAAVSNGYPMLSHSTTNQIFPVFPHALVRKLKQEFMFYEWKEIYDNRTAVRLVTSWATEERDVDHLIRVINIHKPRP